MKYRNPRVKQGKRESPQDFILNFLKFKKQNPTRNITVKAFAIIRAEKGKI